MEKEVNHKRRWTLRNKQRVAGEEVAGGWALRSACDVMSTGYYMQLMNHWILPLKLIIEYMLTKLNLSKKLKKKTLNIWQHVKERINVNE